MYSTRTRYTNDVLTETLLLSRSRRTTVFYMLQVPGRGPILFPSADTYITYSLYCNLGLVIKSLNVFFDSCEGN